MTDVPTPLYGAGTQCYQIKISTASRKDVAAGHSHPTTGNCGSFNMFSGGDILQLGLLYNRKIGADKENYNTYSFILTVNGNAFAIRFDNQQTMAKLGEIQNDPLASNNFIEKFDREYNRLGDNPTENDLIKKMYSLLGENDLDISLYKAEIDNQSFVTDWMKKIIGTNGQVETETCQ